jgi:ribose transport system substrate-binding protein
MRTVRSISVVLAAIAAIAVLASCASKNAKTSAKPGQKQFTVGVTLLTEEHPFYRELKAAFIERCKARNLKPLIQSCNMDLSTQTAQVENFITQKVDAMVVCPAQSAGIAGAVRKANDAKIPVFTADIAAQGGKIVSHIASDNIAGGKLAGEYLAKQFPSSMNRRPYIAIVDDPAVQSVQDRVKGFRAAIAKYPAIKIVEDQNADGKRDMAVTVTENILQKEPMLDGIFAINDSSALGALSAIEQSGRKNIVLVGYDGDPEARQKILAGTALKADAVQYPREIGKATANAVADYLEGKKVPAYIPVKVGLIDQASLKQAK